MHRQIALVALFLPSSWRMRCSVLLASFSFSSWKTNLMHTKYSHLLADESLFAWSTDWLNSTTNVHCTELIVRSAGLMFVKSWLANTNHWVDSGLTNATQICSLTILLTITECTCLSFWWGFLAPSISAFRSWTTLSVLCASNILLQAINTKKHVAVFGRIRTWFMYIAFLWIVTRCNHLFDFRVIPFTFRVFLGSVVLRHGGTPHVRYRPNKEQQ